MNSAFYQQLSEQLEATRNEGLYKKERIITSDQSSEITVNGQQVLNFCANNYLGLANHPDLIAAAKKGLDEHGFGTASVRFICGTQDIHKELEQKLSHFLGTEDTILYSSCFDANGGLFETLMGPEDAIISDELNHASIIDGIRLSKAKRYRYKNNDLTSLEEQLKQADADGARFKLIATDGVFSMDGVIADLKGICDLADKYDALVMMDDCHATGFCGENGKNLRILRRHWSRWRPYNVRVKHWVARLVVTRPKEGSHRRLRQRSRLPVSQLGCAGYRTSCLSRFWICSRTVTSYAVNCGTMPRYFREQMTAAGFTLSGADHAIIPVMIGDARLASEMADRLLEEGIYVISFSSR